MTTRTAQFMLLTTLLSLSLVSQERRMMTFNADEAVILREIGAVVGLEDGSLKVIMVPSPDARRTGTPSVDMQRGDEIGMANGARVKSIAELRSAYDGTAAGSEFKLGLRRDGRPHIVTFERKSEKDMPGGQVMVRRGPEGGSGDVDVFPALGFGVRSEGGTTTVFETLPNAPKEVVKGDLVVSVGGTKVTSTADVSKAVDAAKTGERLTFVLRRDGKEITVDLTKQESPGMIRMIRRED